MSMVAVSSRCWVSAVVLLRYDVLCVLLMVLLCYGGRALELLVVFCFDLI